MKTTKAEMLLAINTLLKLNHMACEFKTFTREEAQKMCDSRISQSPHAVVPDEEFAVITCVNGYRYFINVDGNSQISTVAAIFNFVSLK